MSLGVSRRLKKLLLERRGFPSSRTLRASAAASALLLLFSLLFVFSSSSGGGGGGGDVGGTSLGRKDGFGHHRDDEALMESSTGPSPPSAWVRMNEKNVYNSPSVIPAATLRRLMDVGYIQSIKRYRRVFSRQRFRDVNDEFSELLHMPLVREMAQRRGVGSAGVLYALSWTKAMYTSLRALMSDTLDDRVEQGYYEGRMSAGVPPGISRFVLLELAVTDNDGEVAVEEAAKTLTPSSSPPPPLSPVYARRSVTMLPLLRDMLSTWGNVRAMTIETSPAEDTEERPEGGLWSSLVQSPTLKADLMRAEGYGRDGGRRGESKRACTTVFLSHTGSGDSGSGKNRTVVSPLTDAAVEHLFKLPMEMANEDPFEEEARRIRFSLLKGALSPLHEMLRMRAVGPTGGGGDEAARRADHEREAKLSQIIHERHRGSSGDQPWKRGRKTGAEEEEDVADPLVVARVARAMRPLVDVQVLTSFESLYSRLAEVEFAGGNVSALHRHGGSGGSPLPEPSFRSHLLTGRSFHGTQAEFESFLVFLLFNAREATYIDLPNLFACRGLRRDNAQEREEEERMAKVMESAVGSIAGYNLPQRLRQWYVEPLLAGRTRRERSADGRYNPTFAVGRGPYAKPESKSRRIASMGDLLEAIVASYGVFSDMSLVFEEPTVGFCFPGSTAAAAAAAAPHRRRIPRVTVKYSPDRLQRKKEREKELLLQRADCLSLPV